MKKLTKTQKELLQFIANCPGKVPARAAARTFKALSDNGYTTRDGGTLAITEAGRAYLAR
jgi:hypothetical protein